MARRNPFELIYDPETVGHLLTIDLKHHRLIKRTIKENLSFEPEIETRNRKPLLRPSSLGVDWELRLGPDNRFRVFYRTDFAGHAVHILAIGVKVGSRLFIKGKVFEL